jgi:L-threonylcarbamoyladenylate synthase
MKETKLLGTTIDDLIVAANILKNGGTVIFPTETVYGLGANAKDDEAVKKIFIAKGRPSDNPLIVHIDDFRKIDNYVEEVTDIAKKLAARCWPGPMTLVLKKKKCISDIVSAGLDTVGIRIPQSTEAREFLRLCDLPVAAPSANISGKPSPTTSKHAIDDMMGRVDAIICGKPCEVGVESTVIDATGDVPIILRPGGITPNMVKAVCGDVIIDKGVDGVEVTDKPKSPGMKYKHYAPSAEVILIDGNTIQEIVEKIEAQIKNSKEKTIILCSEETSDYFKDFDTMCLGSRNKPETFAKNLFYAFRECDIKGYDKIILEGIEKEGIGLAVMNRATRAAHK